MYTERLSTLTKAYKAAEKLNIAYSDANQKFAEYTQQLNYATGLLGSVQVLGNIIVTTEQKWQDAILRLMEAQITEYLSYVYPSDGYTVSLSARVLRGKVRIEGDVRSYFSSKISGDMSDTQGRLFQQIVSFAALATVMDILGVETIYIDEAFSGGAKANSGKINKLLRRLNEKNFNLVMIAQDPSIAQFINANVMFLSRSLDNKTSVEQQEVSLYDE